MANIILQYKYVIYKAGDLNFHKKQKRHTECSYMTLGCNCLQVYLFVKATILLQNFTIRIQFANKT